MIAPKWEYTAVDTVISAYRDAGNQVGEWLANLDALGEEGWELVSDTIIYGKGQNGRQWPILLFKRQKQTPPPDGRTDDGHVLVAAEAGQP